MPLSAILILSLDAAVVSFNLSIAWPVAAAIRHFRPEFEAYVTNPESIKDVKHYYRLNPTV
jgi:hypothetical protein